MPNINYHLRNPKGKTKQSIWAHFYNENQRYYIDTNISIFPNDWSMTKKKALSSHNGNEKLNKLLKSVVAYFF